MKKNIALLLVVLGVVIIYFFQIRNNHSDKKYHLGGIENYIIEEWGDCPSSSLVCRDIFIDLQKRFGGWYVTVTYVIEKDQEVSLLKREAEIINVHNFWYLSPYVEWYL